MDAISSIIDHQRTYYFNGTYDEPLSENEPKPPPMLPHGDDINAIPGRNLNSHRPKWSERRKNRITKRKRSATTAVDQSASKLKILATETLLKPAVSASSRDTSIEVKTATTTSATPSLPNDGNNDSDDVSRKALPASEIPDGFPEELVFRALAAYATMRTLSVQLRLSPFTPTAFLRALYLPFPNRLLGSVHVHILRILLHNLQLGYSWNDGTTGPPPLDIVKKRSIDHIKWQLRAGDNLQYLDMHTWPIFYDDYCHLTADIVYASLHDIRDHVDARALNLYGVNDTFHGPTEESSRRLSTADNTSQITQYQGSTLNDDIYDAVVIDSDEDYKVEDDEEEDDDSFKYDDDSYGRTKKKKRKHNTSKSHQRKGLPKHSTTSATNTFVDKTTINFHSQRQQAKPPLPSTMYPTQVIGNHHQQRQQQLYNEQHHYQYATNRSAFNEHPYMSQNMNSFRRQPLVDNGSIYQQYQDVYRARQEHSQHSYQQSNERDAFIPNSIPNRPFEREPLLSMRSHDRMTPPQHQEQPTTYEQSQFTNVESPIHNEADSSENCKETIIIDMTNSPSVATSADKVSGDTTTTAIRSRSLHKTSKPGFSAGSMVSHFFQEGYGLKCPQEPSIPSLETNEGCEKSNGHQSHTYRDRDKERTTHTDHYGHYYVPADQISRNASFDGPCRRDVTTDSHQRFSSSSYVNNHASRNQNPIYYNDSNYHGYKSHPMQPASRPPDFYTWTRPMHNSNPTNDNYANNFCPPSPIHRSGSTRNVEDIDIETPLVDIPIESQAVVARQQQQQKSVSAPAPTECKVAIPSNVGSLDKEYAMSSVSNAIEGRTTSLQKETQSTACTNRGIAQTRLESKTVGTIGVSDKSILKTKSDNSPSRSCVVASQLRAFIRGQRKSIDTPTDLRNEGNTISNETTDDSMKFPMNEAANWSHFSPLKTMRMGAPYHTISLNDKLVILEFLIDELLSVEWISAEFTSRHDINARFGYPYGPYPSDSDVKMVKAADGDLHDELCKVCKETGDVVCCDGCVSVYHGECAGFWNASTLPNIWYCPECDVKDPSSFGPLRGPKKSEVDWFTVDDIQTADRSRCETDPQYPNDSKKECEPVSLKFLAVHGFVFCHDETTDDSDYISSSRVKDPFQPVLDSKKLGDILTSLGQLGCSKWPIDQIPINYATMWKGATVSGAAYFKKKEFFDPTVFENKYCRAPILLEGMVRSKDSYIADEKIFNDLSMATCGLSDLLTSDMSKDRGIVSSLTSNTMQFDAQEVVKSFLLKIESDLSEAFLLNEFWNVREMTESALSWKQAIKQCRTLSCLSRLLLQLVDATHHRAFIENWTHSIVAKPRERVPARRGESCGSLSESFTARDETFRRYWERSQICHLPTLLSKTSRYLRGIGEKSPPILVASLNKRKFIAREHNQYVDHSFNSLHAEKDKQSDRGDMVSKLRHRDSDCTSTIPSLSCLALNSRFDGEIRRRMETFICESKQLIHREIHWPVAGRKLFDPLGCIPATSIRYLGRNGGALFAPFVDYSTLHEVGQVAYCHVWRKRVLLCTQFEHLVELVRMLIMNLNTVTISRCASLATNEKRVRGKNSIMIHATQRDLLTGLDYHLLGNPVATKVQNLSPYRWESSTNIELAVIVQDRVHRSKLHLDAVTDQMQAAKKLVNADSKSHNKPLPTHKPATKKSSQKGSVESRLTANDYRRATTLAANIISFHIDETKKLFQIYGINLSSEHMINLRKKTDYDLSKVLIGNYVDANGRSAMMTRAENSAREILNEAIRPHSMPSSGSLQSETSKSQYPEPMSISATTGCVATPTIDLSRIMATGTPLDWSRQVVQQHKDFARLLYRKYGHTQSFPDSELDVSRRQSIANLNSIFQNSGIQYSLHQVSAVIKESENEAHADFLATSSNSGHASLPSQNATTISNNGNATIQDWQLSTGAVSSQQPSSQPFGQFLSHQQLPQISSAIPSNRLQQQYSTSLGTQSRDMVHSSQSYRQQQQQSTTPQQQQQWTAPQQLMPYPTSATIYGQQQQQHQSYNTGMAWSTSSQPEQVPPQNQQQFQQHQQVHDLPQQYQRQQHGNDLPQEKQQQFQQQQHGHDLPQQNQQQFQRQQQGNDLIWSHHDQQQQQDHQQPYNVNNNVRYPSSSHGR